MFRLVYISSETTESTREDLERLLIQSREKNARLNITGLLLHRPGNFLQVLEGAEDVVQSLMESIRQDSRHHRVITVLEEHSLERDFANWTMAFFQTEASASMPEGYNDLLEKPLGEQALGDLSEKIRLFIEVFKMASENENGLQPII